MLTVSAKAASTCQSDVCEVPRGTFTQAARSGTAGGASHLTLDAPVVHPHHKLLAEPLRQALTHPNDEQMSAETSWALASNVQPQLLYAAAMLQERNRCALPVRRSTTDLSMVSASPASSKK